MPEHRDQTPGFLRDLESFLWHDFEAWQRDWAAWVSRKIPHLPAPNSFDRARALHAALRILQESNSGISNAGTRDACAAINKLSVELEIRPHLSRDGTLSLASERMADPVTHLLLGALHSMQTGQWGRFKLCREPTCRASFYDASKAAAKTWCAMETCGSRNKMRRYRGKAVSGSV